MIKDKRIIVVVLLIIIYFLCSIPINLINNSKYTVYLGASTKVYVNGDEMSVEDDNSNIGFKEVSIYYNEDFVDGYLKTTYSDNNNPNNLISYEVFNKDDEKMVFENVQIAVEKRKKINVINLERNYYVTNEEKDKISKYLDNININGEIEYIIKYQYDLNKNGNKEIIYEIKANGSEGEYDKVILLDNGNKVYQVDHTYTEEYRGIEEGARFEKLVDFNNDGIYEIVIGNIKGLDELDIYKIFNFSNGLVEIR